MNKNNATGENTTISTPDDCTARMLLDLPLSTLGAIIGAPQTKPDKISIASDFFVRMSSANLTQLAILA